ncbi:MAG: acylphosphatase [Thermodesulfobacteriota bacterium]|nr:acylphosphatase [Thermodesulfobacteriota bacterium]
MIRVRLIIEGRVQGVFYRVYTREEAEKNGIKGWVRNLHTGEVEVVAEGEEKSVKKLIAWCKKGPPHANVKNVKIIQEEYIGESDSFSISYKL